MGVRLKPGTLTRLDPGNRLASGLVVASPMQGSGFAAVSTPSFATPVNAVDGTHASYVYASSPFGATGGFMGFGVVATKGGGSQLYWPHSSVSDQYLSAEVWISFSSFQTSSPFISAILSFGGVPGSIGNVAKLRLGDVSVPNNQIESDWGSPSNALATNTLYHLGVSTDGTTSLVVINGQVALSGSTVPALASFTQTFLFRDDQTTGRNPGATIEGFHLWARPLTPKEWAARYADPWAIYRARKSTFAAIAAGSPVPQSRRSGILTDGNYVTVGIKTGGGM